MVRAPKFGIIVAANLVGTGLTGFVLYRKLRERRRVGRG